MANKRSYGRSATLEIKRQTDAAVAATGNFVRMPFHSSSVGMERGNTEDRLAGNGRELDMVFPEVDVVGGDMVVPIDMRYFGHYLTAMFGSPNTTEDTGVYTHTFVSGKDTDDLPAYTIQTGHPSVPKFFRDIGCRLNTLSFNLERSGAAKATLGWVGLSESEHTTTQGGTPTTLTLARVSQFKAEIKSGGSALGNLISGDLTLSNNMEAIQNLKNSGAADGVDAGDFSATGNLNFRFANADLLDDATAGTPVDLELSWTLDADLKLTITLHEIYFSKTKTPVSGAGGVEAALSFMGVKNTSEGEAVEAVLINDLVGTTYTSAS